MEDRFQNSVKPSIPLGYQGGRIVQNTEIGPQRVGFDSDYDKGQMRITLVTLWNERIDIIAWMKEAIEKEDVNILREYLKERYAPSFVEGCKKLVLSGSFSPDQEIPSGGTNMTVYIEIEEGTLQNVYTDSKEDTVVLIDRDRDSEENTLIRILASDGPPPKKILREVERARR